MKSPQNTTKIAVVGKSAFFPATPCSKAFWPAVLELKGLMPELAAGNWPFESFSLEELKKLKDFVINSALLAEGGFPPDGFEIPEDVLKITDVVQILGLFLAKQALEDTQSYSAGKIEARKVKVALYSVHGSGFGATQESGKPRNKDPEPGEHLSQQFARHFGFGVHARKRNFPFPGHFEVIRSAVEALQTEDTELVVLGAIDSLSSVHSIIDSIAMGQRSSETPFSEGMGMIVLRRLPDAETDNDKIYAVLSNVGVSSISLSNHENSLESGAETNQNDGDLNPAKEAARIYQKPPATLTEFLHCREAEFSPPLDKLGALSSEKRTAFFSNRRYVQGASFSKTGVTQSTLSEKEVKKIVWLPETISEMFPVHGPNIFQDLVRAEHLSQFVRLHPAEIFYDSTQETCLNLPFNPVSVSIEGNGEKLIVKGAPKSSLDWKKVRECWVKNSGTRRFFHDLLGVLFGTFVNRVVLEKPKDFYAVTTRPVLYLANHQVGLESPLFMTLSYALTGNPIQAIAKPDHVNAWLNFLLAFAEDSLGKDQPFRVVYYDKTNPMELLEFLKRGENREASLLVHVEGTRASEAGQAVTKLSSVFLDMSIQKNIPIVPVRFVGGLPPQPTTERLDFPHGNGKQDYFFGAPISPEELRKMPYGRRPKFVMDRINFLGPMNDEDALCPPDPRFIEKTKFFVETFGLPKMQAMLFAILGFVDDPCEETSVMVKAVKSGKVDISRPDVPPVLKNFLLHLKTKFS